MESEKGLVKLLPLAFIDEACGASTRGSHWWCSYLDPKWVEEFDGFLIQIFLLDAVLCILSSQLERNKTQNFYKLKYS